MTETRKHPYKPCGKPGGCTNKGCHYTQGHDAPCGLPASAEVHRTERWHADLHPASQCPEQDEEDPDYGFDTPSSPAPQPEAPGHTDLMVTPETLEDGMACIACGCWPGHDPRCPRAPQPEAKEERIGGRTRPKRDAFAMKLTDEIMRSDGSHYAIYTLVAAAFAGREK